MLLLLRRSKVVLSSGGCRRPLGIGQQTVRVASCTSEAQALACTSSDETASQTSSDFTPPTRCGCLAASRGDVPTALGPRLLRHLTAETADSQRTTAPQTTMATAEAPLKVTKDLLGLAESQGYEGSLEYDLGNMAAFEPGALDTSKFDKPKKREAACLELATSITQALVAKIFSLPSEAAEVGRMALLPPPSTALPRAKPLPKPRAPTKWEIFAQQKGIQKNKRSKLVYDDAADEWRRRYGYKKANDENDIAIIEATKDDKPGSDPFAQAKKEKKERISKNEKQQKENLKRIAKAGGKAALPAGISLVSDLGSGPTKERSTRRRHLKDDIMMASKRAGLATASVGKFDRLARGEKEGERAAGKRKQRPELFDKKETTRTSSLVDKIIRERSDDVTLDIDKAVGRFESEARQLRASKKAKTSAGGKGQGAGGKGQAGKAKGKAGGKGRPAGKATGGKKAGKAAKAGK